MRDFIYRVTVFFLVIPIFSIILVEICCRALEFPKISHHNIGAKSQDLIPLIDSNTILLLGDSRVEWGVKPELIKYNNKEQVINLALPGNNGLDIMNYLKVNKIYPKTIIWGFTPNYGRYTNHNLDKVIYSRPNRAVANLKYWLKQNSYFFDHKSITNHFKGERPYFKNHKYDNWGGAYVTEYGNYQERKKVQLKMYEEWQLDFDKDKYTNYLSSIKLLINWFDNRTKIFGLYMPVSDEILKCEPNYNKDFVSNIFNQNYFDYSKFYHKTNINDSLIYCEGSHLSPKYAIHFSNELKARTHNTQYSKKR